MTRSDRRKEQRTATKTHLLLRGLSCDWAGWQNLLCLALNCQRPKFNETDRNLRRQAGKIKGNERSAGAGGKIPNEFRWFLFDCMLL